MNPITKNESENKVNDIDQKPESEKDQITDVGSNVCVIAGKINSNKILNTRY